MTSESKEFRSQRKYYFIQCVEKFGMKRMESGGKIQWPSEIIYIFPTDVFDIRKGRPDL